MSFQQTQQIIQNPISQQYIQAKNSGFSTSSNKQNIKMLSDPI
jgi:hypothetical protein